MRRTVRVVAVIVPMLLVLGVAGTAEAKSKLPNPVLTQTPAKVTTAKTATFAYNATAGVTYTCRLDAGATVACATPKTYTGLAAGNHTWRLNAAKAGFRGSNVTYTWRIDSTPPLVPVVAAVPTPTRSTTASVTWTDSDTSVTGFTCKLDAAAAAPCTSPKALSGLTEGSHTITVTARDAAGNTASASRTWVIDLTPPAAPVVTGPTSPTKSTASVIPWTGDAGATYTCSLDNAVAAPCTSPFTTGTLGEGPHALVVTPTDGVGNIGPAGTAVWVVDTTPPAAPVLVSGPAALTNSTSATIRFADLDTSAVTFTCALDAGAAAPCTNPFTTTVAPNVSHTVAVRALDAAGNPSAPLNVGWTVDTSAPAPAEFLTGPATPTNVVVPVFTWQATDVATTSYTCSLDGATAAPCTASDAIPAQGEGIHTLSLKARDAALNESSPVTWTWKVDTTAPGAPTTGGATALGLVKAAPALAFGSTDSAVAGFRCSVDSGAPQTCATGFVPTVGQGAHSIAVVAVDNAGNVGTSALTFTFTLDSVAPTLTTTVPVTLTDRFVVRFGEAVKGVSASTVGMGAPGVLSCRNATGAVIPCTGAVRAAVVVPTKALVPGQRYTARVLAAVTDAAGNAVAPVARAYRGQLVQQESSAALAETWRAAPAADAFGGRYVVDDVVGATASYAFTGTAITWYTITGPTMGLARVYVDGVNKGVVNNAAAARHTKVGRTLGGLAAGKHVLRIVVVTTRPVVVDAVRVGATTVVNPVLTHRWGVSANRAASAGAFASDDQRASTVAMSFRGTAISWTTIVGPAMGEAQIYVDNVLRATVDNYAAATKYGVKRTLSVKDGLHSIRIVVLGQHRAGGKGNRVILDSLSVG